MNKLLEIFTILLDKAPGYYFKKWSVYNFMYEVWEQRVYSTGVDLTTNKEEIECEETGMKNHCCALNGLVEHYKQVTGTDIYTSVSGYGELFEAAKTSDEKFRELIAAIRERFPAREDISTFLYTGTKIAASDPDMYKTDAIGKDFMSISQKDMETITISINDKRTLQVKKREWHQFISWHLCVEMKNCVPLHNYPVGAEHDKVTAYLPPLKGDVYDAVVKTIIHDRAFDLEQMVLINMVPRPASALSNEEPVEVIIKRFVYEHVSICMREGKLEWSSHNPIKNFNYGPVNISPEKFVYQGNTFYNTPQLAFITKKAGECGDGFTSDVRLITTGEGEKNRFYLYGSFEKGLWPFFSSIKMADKDNIIDFPDEPVPNEPYIMFKKTLDRKRGIQHSPTPMTYKNGQQSVTQEVSREGFFEVLTLGGDQINFFIQVVEAGKDLAVEYYWPLEEYGSHFVLLFLALPEVTPKFFLFESPLLNMPVQTLLDETQDGVYVVYSRAKTKLWVLIGFTVGKVRKVKLLADLPLTANATDFTFTVENSPFLPSFALSNLKSVVAASSDTLVFAQKLRFSSVGARDGYNVVRPKNYEKDGSVKIVFGEKGGKSLSGSVALEKQASVCDDKSIIDQPFIKTLCTVTLLI